MRPTFSSFTIAKLGLDAARANLQVTGQNMTNANSAGFTRQRVDTYAMGAGNRSMRYSSLSSSFVGGGVMIGGISQLRDPYLDVRYRREHAKAGSSVAQYDTLHDLGYIFGSVTEEGFETEFSNLKSQLQELSKKPSDPVAEKIVKTQATTVLQIFNECAERLSSIQKQQFESLRDGAIKQTNDYLANIARLNQEIRSANVSGNPALELQDQRNLLLDELSQFCNIEVSVHKTDIGSGQKVDELTVNLVAPHGEKFMLVDNNQYRQFAIKTDATGTSSQPYGILLTDSNGRPVDYSNTGGVSLEDGDISAQLTTGAFQGYLKMLNAAGEFGDPPSKVRGIPYYQQMLDTLASKFAEVMNAANSTNGTNDKPLFEAKGGGKITAANIVISQAWEMANDNYITNTKAVLQPGQEASAQNDNILAMIDLFSAKMEYKTEAGYPLFTGGFQECVSHIVTTYGLEMKNVERLNDTYLRTLSDIQQQKDSVSAVNIDEEGINLIMYNQALVAASRFMTTLDEALETIISRMGIVGR